MPTASANSETLRMQGAISQCSAPQLDTGGNGLSLVWVGRKSGCGDVGGSYIAAGDIFD